MAVGEGMGCGGVTIEGGGGMTLPVFPASLVMSTFSKVSVPDFGFRVSGPGFKVSDFRVAGLMDSSQLENNYFTEMCGGSKAGSFLRLTDFVHHSTLGWGVIKKQKRRLPRRPVVKLKLKFGVKDFRNRILEF